MRGCDETAGAPGNSRDLEQIRPPGRLVRVLQQHADPAQPALSPRDASRGPENLMGVMGVVRRRPRHWCSMVTGTVLCIAGIKLGDGWSVLIFAGIWAFVYSVALPERPYADWYDQPRDETRRPGFNSRRGRTGVPPGRGTSGRSCPAETRA